MKILITSPAVLLAAAGAVIRQVCPLTRVSAGGINMHILARGSAPPLPGFLNALAGPLDHFGYWAVLLLVMLEDFGIPVPGETVLIAASV